MSALPDYYQILGVHREAGHAAIVRAYREQAMKCHPDHGGSHEAMLRINEAWNILRNPDSRRAYDEWLAHQGIQSASITTAVQHARSNASQYPRQWTDFEKWMDALSKDFTQADYGWSGGGMWQAPTAGNSFSGKVIIFIGCGLGFLIGGSMALAFKGSQFQGAALILGPIGLALGGATGAFIHKMISSGINAVRQPSTSRTTPRQPPQGNSTPTPNSQPVGKIKITCPHCGQRIEAPADYIGTVVTCPTCNKEFHVGKRAPQPPPIPIKPSQPPPIPNQPPPLP